MLSARLLFPTMALASAAGCAAVLGADFDRQLEPAASVSDAGVDVDVGADADTSGDALTDAPANEASLEGGVFVTGGVIERIKDVFTNGVDVFWTSLDSSANPTHVTFRARNVDGNHDRVVTAAATSGMSGGIVGCFSIAAGGDSVWFANSAEQSAGAIISANGDGTGVVNRVVNEDSPCQLTLLQGRPYWWPANSRSLRTATANGAATTVLEDFYAVNAVADSASIFADSYAYFDGNGAHRAVLRLDIGADGGGVVVPLAREALAGQVGGLSLSPAHVFWADTESGRVLSVPKSGGSTVVVASGLGVPRSVVYRDSFVYFSTDPTINARDAGNVSRIRVLDGNPVGAIEPLATARDHPWQLSVDATHVYWIESGARIVRARIDGT